MPAWQSAQTASSNPSYPSGWQSAQAKLPPDSVSAWLCNENPVAACASRKARSSISVSAPCGPLCSGWHGPHAGVCPSPARPPCRPSPASSSAATPVWQSRQPSAMVRPLQGAGWQAPQSPSSSAWLATPPSGSGPARVRRSGAGLSVQPARAEQLPVRRGASPPRRPGRRRRPPRCRWPRGIRGASSCRHRPVTAAASRSREPRRRGRSRPRTAPTSAAGGRGARWRGRAAAPPPQARAAPACRSTAPSARWRPRRR